MRRLDTYPVHYLLLQWILFTTALLFVLYLAWSYDFFKLVFESDPTRISIVISLIFLGGTIHCALRAWFLSGQLNEILHIAQVGENVKISVVQDQLSVNDKTINDSLVAKFLLDSLKNGQMSQSSGEQKISSELVDILSEQASGPHETGWFFVHLLIKLGLLGTVVGFVLMLTSFSDINSIEYSDLQDMISNMATGMGVALTTTLVGLVTSMLLGFQYLMLDRGADRLVSMAVRFANISLRNNTREEVINGDSTTSKEC